MIPTKLISTEFLSTVSLRQSLYSIGLILRRGKKLQLGSAQKDLINDLELYFIGSNKKIFLYYNGRTAIYQALKILGIKPGDEVIVSGYTCISVINAVIQSGAKIVYCDIDTDTLGISPKILKKRISKKTKAIIAQHTFGLPCDIKKIKEIAQSNNIALIEDCAHGLGTKVDNTHLGTFGDFGIISMSRDKVISSVSGGILLVNNDKYTQKAKQLYKETESIGTKIIRKDLLYNILGYKAQKLYHVLSIGKGIMHIATKWNFINKIITNTEKNCNYTSLHYKMPNALCSLAIKELFHLDQYTQKRKLYGEYYTELLKNKKIEKFNIPNESNHFRYPILLKNNEEAKRIYEYMKSNNIYLGNYWSGDNIVPKGSNIQKTQYTIGTCENAEDISARILLLPNHPNLSEKQVLSVIQLLNNFK